MIAWGNEHGTHGTQANESTVKKSHRFRARNRAVINIAGNNHQLDLFRVNTCDEPINEHFLMNVHALGQKSSSQVPVGSVQDFHSAPKTSDAPITTSN
jgi:hypothetical protein